MSERRPLETGTALSVQAASWRSCVEKYAFAAWCAVFLISLGCLITSGNVFACVTGTASLIMAAVRGFTMYRTLRARAALAGFDVELMSMDSLLKLLSRVNPAPEEAKDKTEDKPKGKKGNQKRPDSPYSVWFGYGFDWTPEHAQKLYEISKISVTRLIPSAWMCEKLLRRPVKNPDAIGCGYLHGLNATEGLLTVAEKTLEGGTLIVGTTQAGKGVLMNQLIAQAIAHGDTVIILDPKNSPRMKRTVIAACKEASREAPFLFHPGRNDGVRLNPLADFSSTSELAGRISSLMSDDGPFTAFAWSAVHVIVQLLLATDRVPTFSAIESAVINGIDGLLEEAIALSLKDEKMQIFESQNFGPREKRLDNLIAFWEAGHSAEHATAIEAAVAVHRHDPAHYAKITAGLVPILGMLTSGTLRTSLSPDTADKADMRPVVTMETLMNGKGVLYVSLNALPDATTASALGATLLGALAASAGERYNKGKDCTRVTLFVDECANVINRPLIEILNKGAESGIRTTCAMQTVSDLAARLGSDQEARMALGNFNNLVALRTKDRVTQEFVAETFGSTYIAGVDASISSGSRTGDAGLFSVSYSRRLHSTREEIIPSDTLGTLPNCEFFASLAGGRLVKGRIPILITEGAA